ARRCGRGGANAACSRPSRAARSATRAPSARRTASSFAPVASRSDPNSFTVTCIAPKLTQALGPADATDVARPDANAFRRQVELALDRLRPAPLHDRANAALPQG